MSASEQTGGNGVLETTPDMSGLHCFVLLARLLNRVINPDNLCHMMGIPDGRFAANDMVRAGQKYGFRSRVGKVLGEDYRSTIKVEAPEFSVETQKTYQTDGTLKSAEAEDVHVRMSKARAKELGLDVAGKTADQNGFYGFTAADAGAVLGSSFGTSLAGANQFKQVAYGSTLGVLGHDLGNWITSANSSTSTSSSSSIGAWLKNLPKRIGDQLAVTTQNVLVVIGVSEITKKLGLSNFAANTFTAATASAVNNVVTSITNGAKNVSQAVKAVNWSQALTAVSAYMGSYLASKVIEVKSKSAAIVQAAFTAVARSLLAPA